MFDDLHSRRTLLRIGAIGVAGLLAGCLAAGAPRADGGVPGGSDGDGPDGDDSDGAAGTRPSGTGGPGVALVDVDPVPDLPVEPAVEVVRDVATADHPPQIRVTVTNVSEESIRVGEGRAIVFQYVHDTTHELLLLPAEGDWPAEPDCWRLTDGIAVTEEYRIVDLAPGESVSALVDLYGAASGEQDACLPVGEFRFETSYAVTTDADGVPDEGPGASWGFSLSLE
jgi:hypothetical protein